MNPNFASIKEGRRPHVVAPRRELQRLCQRLAITCAATGVMEPTRPCLDRASQALRRLPHGPCVSRLHRVAVGAIRLASGDTHAALEALQAAVTDAVKREAKSDAASSGIAVAAAHALVGPVVTGRWARKAAVHLSGASVPTATRTAAHRACALAMHAQLLARLGRAEAASKALALALRGPISCGALEGYLMLALEAAHHDAGDWEKSLRAYTASIAVAQAHHDPRLRLDALTGQANVLEHREGIDETLQALQEAVGYAQDCG
eukprot:m51a1_g6527 hypothetical protein (263) ;mRNA; r:5815-6927